MCSKILVSACLLGNKVRYDGNDKHCHHAVLTKWHKEGRVVLICPEVAAGLPIPRAPAEMIGGGGNQVLQHHARVIEATGKDVSEFFIQGAELALQLCRENDIRVAVLTDKSPSCGSTTVYDGCFSGCRINGEGVTTALLRQHGIKVFSEHGIQEALKYISETTD